jgi:hypothetical protein
MIRNWRTRNCKFESNRAKAMAETGIKDNGSAGLRRQYPKYGTQEVTL